MVIVSGYLPSLLQAAGLDIIHPREELDGHMVWSVAQLLECKLRYLNQLNHSTGAYTHSVYRIKILVEVTGETSNKAADRRAGGRTCDGEGDLRPEERAEGFRGPPESGERSTCPPRPAAWLATVRPPVPS